MSPAEDAPGKGARKLDGEPDGVTAAAGQNPKMVNGRPVAAQYYADYLGLDKLLDAQHMVSRELGQDAHDEMLFIIVHQAHELWFKQILHEIDSIVTMFEGDNVDERSMTKAVARLERVIEIQKTLLHTLRILETMTSLDFLDFRDLLSPASGFQSYQYRLVENKLGLKPDDRLPINRASYLSRFSPEHRALIEASQTGPNLFDLMEKWLERTPFLKFERFDFLDAYRTAVDEMIAHDRETITTNPTLTEEVRASELKQLDSTYEEFALLFDEERYEQARKAGKKRLSYRATMAALLIQLYRDQPILTQPFRFLERLLDVDEHLTMWRQRHAIMVHRMIGAKIGTGGSSGLKYLTQLVDAHRIYTDLFDLSTYLIPRSQRPPLPTELVKELGFQYTDSHA